MVIIVCRHYSIYIFMWTPESNTVCLIIKTETYTPEQVFVDIQNYAEHNNRTSSEPVYIRIYVEIRCVLYFNKNIFVVPVRVQDLVGTCKGSASPQTQGKVHFVQKLNKSCTQGVN